MARGPIDFVIAHGAIVLALGLLSTPAGADPADPVSDAIAHQDLDGLRAMLPSPAAKCGLSVVYARRHDLVRAGMHLDGCDEAQLPEATRGDLIRTLRKLHRDLKDSELSELYIDTRPAGLSAEVSALRGEHFTTPVTVWVPAGTHVVRAAIDTPTPVTNSITTKPHSSAHVFLDAGKPTIAPPKNGHVEFGEEGDIGDKQDGPPPDVKHGTLMPNKFVTGGTTGGEHIDDPLAVRERETPPDPPRLSVGLRAGGGAFGHTGGSRISPSLALVSRIVAPWEASGAQRPFELGARLDWSRRGGDDARFDVIAPSLEVDKVIAATDAAWIGVGLAVRADLRFGTMAAALPIHQLGIGAAGSIDLALRDLPIVFGVRYEQGITELADGIREHAILVEAGMDLRRFGR